MTIRKGQKLCNWILDQGYPREDVHVKLFHMSDEQFDKVINMKVEYEVPDDTTEGNEIIHEQAKDIIDFIFNPPKNFKLENCVFCGGTNKMQDGSECIHDRV